MNAYWLTMKVLMAQFSLKLQPHLGSFIRLSIHSASLSLMDFCLQDLIGVSIHIASEVNRNNLSKVRSQWSDNSAPKLQEPLVSNKKPLQGLSE